MKWDKIGIHRIPAYVPADIFLELFHFQTGNELEKFQHVNKKWNKLIASNRQNLPVHKIHAMFIKDMARSSHLELVIQDLAEEEKTVKNKTSLNLGQDEKIDLKKVEDVMDYMTNVWRCINNGFFNIASIISQDHSSKLHLFFEKGLNIHCRNLKFEVRTESATLKFYSLLGQCFHASRFYLSFDYKVTSMLVWQNESIHNLLNVPEDALCPSEDPKLVSWYSSGVTSRKTS